MAFDIASHKNVRLTQISAGQRVTLCDFDRKKAVFTANFIGWFHNGKAVAAPTSMKGMEQGHTIRFVAVKTVDGELFGDGSLVLEQAPNTYGAMFLKTVTGEGDEQKATFRRITAYETLKDSEAKTQAKATAKAAKEAEKAAKAAEAAKAAPTVEEAAQVTETTETTEEQPA